MAMIWCVSVEGVTRRRIKKQRETHKNCESCFLEITRRLDSSIARTITCNIPLIPANTGLRGLLQEITEKQYRTRHGVILSTNNFLIRKNKYVELITAQSVFEYVANGYDPDDTIMDNIRRVRIPFVPRTKTIGDAFQLMIDNVPSRCSLNARTSRCCWWTGRRPRSRSTGTCRVSCTPTS